MAPNKPGRGSDQFPLRLPDGMRDRIKVAAAENGRSMNAEIVGTLQEAYPDYNDVSDKLAQMVMIACDILEQQGVTEKSDAYFDILGEVMAKIHGKMDLPKPKHRTRDVEIENWKAEAKKRRR